MTALLLRKEMISEHTRLCVTYGIVWSTRTSKRNNSEKIIRTTHCAWIRSGGDEWTRSHDQGKAAELSLHLVCSLNGSIFLDELMGRGNRINKRKGRR